MSLLTIAQDAASELPMSLPALVTSSADKNVRRLLRAINKEGKLQVSGDYQWKALTRQATFTSVAAELQGALADLAPGYRYMVGQTGWNRDNDYALRGSISPQEWQFRQAFPFTGLRYDFRIIRDELHIIPAPSAGQTIVFEYVSAHWVTNSAGTQSYDAFTADSDVPLLDEELLTLAAIWRWRKGQGLEFETDYLEYDRFLKNLKRNDVPAMPLDFTAGKIGVMDEPDRHLPFFGGTI